MTLVPAPVSMGAVYRSNPTAAPHVEIGDELLMAVNFPGSGVSSGYLLAHCWLSPIMLWQTRLRALSLIYAQHRFRKLELEYIPQCSTSSNGGLAIALDKNVTNEITTGSTALSYVMACENSILGPVWQPQRIVGDCRQSASRQRWYLNDLSCPVDESTQFRALVAIATPTTVSGGITVLFKIKYHCEFSQPINAVNSPPFAPITEWVLGTSTLQCNTEGSFTTTSPALSSSAGHGQVYLISPQITGASTNGSPAIGAIMSSTTSASASSLFGAFDSVQSALAWTGAATTTGTGNVNGNDVVIGFDATTVGIPVGFGNPVYHT